MRYPEVPTCHDDDYQARRFAPQSWYRQAADTRNPDGELFRRCSYCGSIHPEDLLTVLQAGAILQGADWKGWPHKFYVANIPNPNRDRRVEIGSSWDGTTDTPILGTEGDFHAKWYNEHIKDAGFDDEARSLLIERLEHFSGIAFTFTDGKLMFRAPYAGYQR